MKFSKKLIFLFGLLCCLCSMALLASAEEIFHSSDYMISEDDYAYEVDTENYLFVNSSKGDLHMLNKSTGIATQLMYDVLNYITDGNTVYYKDKNDDCIYRINVGGTESEYVYSGATSVVGCWNNKYLYYYQYSEYESPEYSTWLLDLESNATKMIFADCPSNLQAYNGKLYYTLFAGDNAFADLYVSELDGSNPSVLIEDVNDFEIIDNQIYYAKSDTDYGYGSYSFYVARCDMEGVNSAILADNIISTGITSIRKDKCSYFNGSVAEFVDYATQDAVSVLLNGMEIKFDQPPIIVDGRTLVPVRAVVEEMGGKVEWDETTQTVTLTLNADVMKLIIGSTTAFLNGEANTLDVPPQIINGRTLLPIRFVAEGFAFTVDWDENTQTVIITNNDASKELVYRNKKMGYQLTFPESFRGYYRIHEYENGGVNICFYGKSETAKNNVYSDYFPGIPLFMILPEDAVAEDEYLDSVTKIGTVNGTDYYYATGTDASLGVFDSLNYTADSNEKTLMQADFDKAMQMFGEAMNTKISEIDYVVDSQNDTSKSYKDVTYTMSDSLLDEFNAFVCAEARTAEIAPHNILANYDCAGNNSIRDMNIFVKYAEEFGIE